MVHINFMVHADDVNLLGESIGTTKKKRQKFCQSLVRRLVWKKML